jgi:mono/diheme cytochrome c family protein
LKSFLGKVDFAVAAVVWGIAAGLVLMLFIGPQLIAEDKPAATTTTPAAETGEEEDAGTEVDGQAVFVENCGSCHTLSAAGTSGAVGPSLDGAGLSADVVAETVRSGRGAMPAFEGTLDEAEIAAVVAFVAEASAP